MPASRSRTDRWRECLYQVYERGGALEISVPSNSGGGEEHGDPKAASLIWRVRMTGLNDREIFVESPSTMGQTIDLKEGVEVIAAMAIGQNRWMFRTRVLGALTLRGPGAGIPALRLAMPESVERCMRRNFYRISTAELALPAVECWPLLSPASVVAAEVANRALILELLRAGDMRLAREDLDEPIVLPEVGPKFRGSMVNIGGGGVGLMIDRNEAALRERTRLFWLRINLMPQIPAPIAVTARMVHTHIDSGQNLYAGMAFEFHFNPAHRQFVVEQICRYVSVLQNDQRNTAERTA